MARIAVRRLKGVADSRVVLSGELQCCRQYDRVEGGRALGAHLHSQLTGSSARAARREEGLATVVAGQLSLHRKETQAQALHFSSALTPGGLQT